MRKVMLLAAALILAVAVSTACVAEAQRHGLHAEVASRNHAAHDYYLKYQENAREMNQGTARDEVQIAAVGPDARTVQIGCEVWKTDAIDPIVDPPLGMAHLHDFIGNRSTNADRSEERRVGKECR